MFFQDDKQGAGKQHTQRFQKFFNDHDGAEHPAGDECGIAVATGEQIDEKGVVIGVYDLKPGKHFLEVFQSFFEDDGAHGQIAIHQRLPPVELPVGIWIAEFETYIFVDEM